MLSTATADVGNLRFYQLMGFRFESIDRDAFTPATGYPEPIDIDGIALRDRIGLTSSADLVRQPPLRSFDASASKVRTSSGINQVKALTPSWTHR